MTRQELIRKLQDINPQDAEGEVVVIFWNQDLQQYETQPIVEVDEDFFIYLVAESAK